MANDRTLLRELATYVNFAFHLEENRIYYYSQQVVGYYEIFT